MSSNRTSYPILTNTGVDLANIPIVTKCPTGFDNPSNVIVTGNSTNRTITLTGTFNAYWNGILNTTIVSGYVSPVHGTDTSKVYYLYYNGSTIAWYDTIWTFDILQIAIAIYDNSNLQWYYLRECHGFMDYLSHQELHQTIGTYLVSGGDLSSYTLGSTTATNRRPIISSLSLKDEDLLTVSPALSTNSYTIRYLSSTNTVNYTIGSTEISLLSTNRPYYNQFTGGNWVQTLFGNNEYGAIFLVGIPSTSDSISQSYRYQYIQPQTVSTNLTTIQSLTTQSINWGADTSKSAEFVVFGKIIIRYTGGNWQLISVEKLTGTSATSVASSTGGAISSVTISGNLLSGNGTAANPLTAIYRDGFMDYSHSGTTQSYTSGDLKVLNDGNGAYTLKTYKPIGVTEFWNTTTNQFNFADLALGDEVWIRTDGIVTTTTNNQIFCTKIRFDIGGTPYDIQVGQSYYKSIGTYQINRLMYFYIGNTGTLNNPAELLFSSDAAATIQLNGFAITVKRRF